MKILICGDRNWSDGALILQTLRDVTQNKDEIIVIHGCARGADTLGGVAATCLGFEIHLFPANWTEYGKAAGPIRNKQMLKENPNLVLAFHDNIAISKGTKNMIEIANKAGVLTRVITHG